VSLSVGTMEEGWARTSLLLVGGATLLYWLVGLLWNIAHLFRCFIWARLFKGQPWTTRFGQWAVVTGASDGIGKAYVHKLAARGMNVVLIARNKDKLDRVAQYVRSEYGIETSVVIADFGDGQSIYGNIAKELEGKDIGVLVNNVGVSGQLNRFFHEYEEKPMWDIMNINVANVPAVTKIVLPGMLQRKRGVIINIGSMASVMPMPTVAMYCASKAFVDFFSQALSAECEGTGVLVQGVHPGLVDSNMTKTYKDHTDMGNLPSVLFPTADVYVDSALATVGHTDYTHGTLGHSLTRVMMLFTKALPFNIGNKVMLKEAIKTREVLEKNMKT
ncbi:unnamed protein product, partial [Meganyctiphanes norvegica]